MREDQGGHCRDYLSPLWFVPPKLYGSWVGGFYLFIGVLTTRGGSNVCTILFWAETVAPEGRKKRRAELSPVSDLPFSKIKVKFGAKSEIESVFDLYGGSLLTVLDFLW